MFCSRCGKEASEASKYCSACGFSLQQSSVAGPSGIDSEAKQPVVKSPMNFQEFLKRKAENRKEHFKFRPKSAKKVEKDVSINIGIMRYVNGTLKCVTFYLQQLFDLQQLFYLHHFFYLQHLFLFAATFFICSSFFYLQQLFLFAATFLFAPIFLFAAPFFICSNFFYLQQHRFLFAATFFICIGCSV